MMNLKTGNIIFARLPFSDASDGKYRPCLVVYDGCVYPNDCIVAMITSVTAVNRRDIVLPNTMLTRPMPKVSYVRLDRIATIDTSEAVLMSSVNQELLTAILGHLAEMFDAPPKYTY